MRVKRKKVKSKKERVGKECCFSEEGVWEGEEGEEGRRVYVCGGGGGEKREERREGVLFQSSNFSNVNICF